MLEVGGQWLADGEKSCGWAWASWRAMGTGLWDPWSLWDAVSPPRSKLEGLEQKDGIGLG